MKIEIADEYYEAFKRLLVQQYPRFEAATNDPQTRAELDDAARREIDSALRRQLWQEAAPGYDFDALTECKTRPMLERDLKRAIVGDWRSRRKQIEENPVYRNTYLCLDVENFKSFNMMHGLTKGDQALKAVAQELRAAYPQANIYRFGGEEFVVELGERAPREPSPDLDVKLRRCILRFDITKDHRRHHSNEAVNWCFARAMLEATPQGKTIIYKYPD